MATEKYVTAFFCLYSILEQAFGFIETLPRDHPVAMAEDTVAHLNDKCSVITLNMERHSFLFEEWRHRGGLCKIPSELGEAIGLCWDDVRAMLDEDGKVAPQRLGTVIDKIEAKPITRNEFVRHYLKHLKDDKVEARQALLSPEFEAWYQAMLKQREELLAILRKAIELDEPLEVIFKDDNSRGEPNKL